MAQMDIGITTCKSKTIRESEVWIGNGGVVSFYSPESTTLDSQGGGDVLTKLHKNLDRLDGLVGRLRFVMNELKNSVNG